MSNQIPNSLRIFILLATTALFATTSKAAVLYDQTAGFAGLSAASQEFAVGGPNDSATCAGADDFVVPVGGWTIRSIDVNGTIINDPAPVGFGLVTNVDVIIYADASGSPGAPVATYTDLVPAFQDTTGNFTVNLPCGVNLAQGTYWLSVVADEDFATFGQWGWGTIPGLPSGNFAHWQNPLNGLGTGCTSWTVRTACGAVGSDADNAFALHDSVQGCVTVFPYTQDFEACAGHWMSGGTAPTWSLGTPNGGVISGPAAPGVNSWWTNNGGGATRLPIGEQSFVMSPCFDFSNLQNPEIVLDINNDSSNSLLNGAVLQYSLNNGVTWQNVGSGTTSTVTTLGPSANWFDAAGLPTGAGGQNVAHWTSINTSGWATAHHLLTDPTGTVSLGGQSNVILRIAFASNTIPFGQGFGFDNIIIREGPTTDMAINSVSAPVSGCGLSSSESVTVELENLGTVANSSYSVTFEITGPNGDTVTETSVPSIPAFATQNYTFTATFDASAAGIYNGIAYVSSPGDGNQTNNTVTFSFESLLVPADPTALVDDTICGLDTLCLTASGSNLSWWDAPMGGTELLRDDTLKVINPSATDTFWVSNNTLTEDSLFVSLASGNGQNGNFFTVNVTNGVTVTGFYGHTNSTAATDWEIWYRPGALTGTEFGSNAGWTLVTTVTGVPGQGAGNLTPIDLGLNLQLPAGSHGFHVIATTGGVAYTNGTTVGNLWAGDSEIQVLEGWGTAGLGTGTVYSPRNFNGAITYEIPGCESNRLAVYGVVETADPVTIANDTSICGTPGPVSFSANSTGAYTYTWSGTANSGLLGTFAGNPLVTTPSFGSSQVFVEGVDGNGCTARDTASIAVASVSIDTILGLDSICPGDSTSLTATVTTGGVPPGIVLFEDFTTFALGANAGQNGWTEAGTQQFWQVEDFQPTSGTSTGPANDHTTTVTPGTSRYVYLETSSAGTGISNQLISPLFNLSGFTSTQLSFWYHMHGAGMGTLNVDVSTDSGTTWTNVFTRSGPDQGSNIAPWINVTVPIASNVNRIRFEGLDGTTFTGDMAIDDVEVSGSPLNFSWSPTASLTSTNTASTIAFPSSSTTTYQVVAIDPSSGCSDTATIDVITRTPPAAPVAADSARCGAGTVLMTAVGSGGLLRWFDLAENPIGAGSTVSSPVVSSNTGFLVNETDVNVCVSDYDTAFISIFTADSILVTISDTLICGSGTTITLTVSQQGSLAYSYNYTWSSTAGGGLNSTLGTPVTAVPTQSATYTVVGQDLGGSGCQAIETVDVVVGTVPVVPVSVSNDTVCAGDSIFLSAVSSSTLLFEDFEGLASLDPGTLPAGWNRNRTTDPNWRPGTTNGGFMSSSGTGPAFDHTTGASGGGVVFMETSSGVVGDTGDIQSPPINLTGFTSASVEFWYYMHGPLIDRMGMDVSTDGGATWTNLWVEIGQQQTTQALPWLSANIDLSAYVGQTINLRWWGINVGCCTGDVALDDVLVTAAKGFNYAWSGGVSSPNSSSTNAFPTANTDYIVTVTDPASGCEYMDTISVAAIPLPPTPVALDTNRCGAGTVVLEATTTGTLDSLRWYDMAGNLLGTGSPLTSPIISGTTDFQVREIDGACPGPFDTMTATVISADSIQLSVNDTSVCGSGTTVSITATQQGSLAYTYVISWSIDSGSVSPLSGATTNASATSSAIVTAVGSDAVSGCSTIETATITVIDPPVVTASVDDDSVCVGDTLNLAASVSPSPFAYNVEEIAFDTFANAGTPVSLGFNQSAIVPIGFNFEFYGNTYSAGFITSNGLFGFDPTNVTLNTSPAIPNAATPNNFIAGLWEYLRPDNSTTVPSVRYQTVGVAPNRVFVITYADVPFGFNTGNTWFQIQLYEGSNVIEVHTKEVTTAGFQSSVVGIENATGTEATFVSGRNDQDFDVITPDAYRFSPPSAYSFGWMPMAGVLNPDTLATQAVVSASTSYIFMATDSGTGCTGYDTVDVYTNPVLPAPFGLDVDACGTQSVTLSALPSFLPPSPQNDQDSIFYYILPADTLLGTGISVNTPILSDTTQFRIVERINGCEGNDLIISANIQQADTIVITPSDTFLCDTSANIVLTASSLAPYNYTWTGAGIVSGANSATVTVSPNATTTYQVTGIDPTPPGCQDVAFITIEVGTPPALNLSTTDDSICVGDTVTLQAFNPPAPFFEDFSSWPAFSSAPGINGWTKTGFWQSEETTTSSTATGPNIDHTSQVSASPSRYIYLEASSAGTGSSSFFTSPVFDVRGLSNTTFSFWYHMYGSDMGTLNAQVSTNGGATWTTVWTQTGQVQTSNAAPWLNTSIPISNNVNRIRFQGIDGSSFNGDMAIDDIEVTGIQPYTVSWSPSGSLTNAGINAPQAFPTTTTEYIVTVTDTTSGCFSIDTVEVQVTPTPAAPMAFDSSRCGFGTLNLAAMAANNNDSLRWYDLAGGQIGSGTPLVSPAIGTTTQFQVAEWTNGCEGEYDTMTATVIQADSIAITSSDTAVCGSGTTVSFSATQIGGSSYSYVYTWTGASLIDSTGATASATVNAPGTYTVVGTDTSGAGCANTNSIFVDQNPLPVVSLPSNDTICAGDTINLAAAGIPALGFSEDFESFFTSTSANQGGWTESGSVLWQSQSGQTGSFNTGPAGDNTLFPATTGQYIYLETSSGATGTTSEFTSPTFNVSSLANTTLSFWYHMFGAAMGTLEVEVSTDGGASWTNVFSISGQQQFSLVDPWTQVTIPISNSVNRIRFVGIRGTSYTSDMAIDDVEINGLTPIPASWTPTAGLSNPMMSITDAYPSASTQYIVTVTDTATGCFASDTIDVEVIPLPAAPVAVDTNRCGIGTVDLIASGSNNDSLFWFDLAGNLLGTGSPITSPFLTSNDQFVVRESDRGCVGPNDTADVTIIPAATISISASDTQVCGSGTTVTLLASQSAAAYTYNYMWSASTNGGLNATMGDSVTATPTATGVQTYVVNGTDAGSGCANTDTIQVLVESIPIVTATATPDSVCSGDPVNLSATVVPTPGNYTVTSIVFDTLAGVGTNVNLPFDNSSQLVPIGFNFDFYGNTYTQLWVGSNGFLTFTNSFTTAADGLAVPNAGSANNLIALAWEDLDIPAQGGTVDYYTTGSAPNRVFVVNFREVGFDFSTTSKVSIQAQLHEATGNIEIHNVRVNIPTSFQTPVQGIENATGTIGVAVPGRNNTNWSASNDAWLFAPIPPQSYLWTGQAIANATQLNTTANPTSSGNYTLTVTTSTGCTASDTVPVNILPLPFNLTPNNLQTTATDFRWNSGNPGSAYTVYWGAVGFIPSGPGQLGSTAGTSVGGINTTGTATTTTVVSQGNTVSNSTATQVFNVPAGGNITSATLNLRARGDLDGGFPTEYANALINGNVVGANLTTGPGFAGQCATLAPVGSVNIDVTALLQGNPTVNLEFFISSDVSGTLCSPAPANELEWSFTIDTVVAGPTTATGLFPNTTYQFYVEEDCGITGPINFTTPIGCFWLGNNSNWNDPSNWSAACGGVPRGCGAPDVSVGPTSNDPIVTADDSLNNIDILAGASVTIDPTINLFVCGDWTNNGTFSHGDGRVVMDGDTSQTIFGASDFGFLEINNTSGNDVSLDPGADVGLQDGLVMTNADLNVPGGASLTILSNSVGTGYVDDFSSPTAGSINGNITMQRLVRNTGAGRAFYYISSAVGGTGVADWSDDFDTRGSLYGIPSNGNRLNGRQVIPTAACLVDSLDPYSPYGGLFEYIETAVTGCTLEGWHVRTTGGINAGEGYAGIIPDGVVVDVTGPANTGTITKSITRTTTNTATPGFVLVGNPYPSAIDWAQVVIENGTAINGTAYMWQSTGFYSGVSLPLNVMVSGEIGSSQGFEVEALKDTVLTFTQTQRTTGDPAFVRSAPLWDQRIDLIVEGNNYADVTRIIFSDVSTDGFDGWYDSYKHEVNSFQPSIWSMLSNDDMGINSFGEFDGSEVVDVRMKPGTNGTYTIKAEFLETFDATTLAFLEDKQTGTIHCLTFNPNYTFTSNVNDAADRFLVYFTPPAQITTIDASCSGYDGSITVDLGVFNHAGSAFEWDAYQVIDNNNVVVASGSNVNGVINVPGVTAGSYTLELEYNGNSVSKPIVVDGDQAVVAAFTTTGNNHFEGDPIDFVNSSTGANDYTWDFGDGTILNGVVNPTYAYAAAGTYLVKLISVNDDGCQDIKTETVEVQSKTSTGIEDLDNMLAVYGAENTIFVNVIDVTEPETKVEVYDMNGKLIISETFEGENLHTIPMNEASGYYIVRASNGDVTVSRKVLIVE